MLNIGGDGSNIDQFIKNINPIKAWDRLNIKMSSYQYGDPMTVLSLAWESPIPEKEGLLYWDGALVTLMNWIIIMVRHLPIRPILTNVNSMSNRKINITEFFLSKYNRFDSIMRLKKIIRDDIFVMSVECCTYRFDRLW